MNGWFDEWRGYAFDEPSGTWPEAKYREELALRRLLWARLMTQMDKTVGSVRSALWRLRTCGRGSGFARSCDNGHEYFTPLGCGSPWCLRCQGMNADLRAMRVHRDIRALLEVSESPVVVRVQLTLAPSDRESVIRCGREGTNAMVRHARKAIVRASGSDGSMPLMVTMHPTSSKRPWIKAPHVHATAIWADMNESGTSMLPWSDSGPVDLPALKEAWGSFYPSSSVVRASYHRRDPQSGLMVRHDGLRLGRALRYDLRPFQEDVWVALAERRMGVPGGSMRDITNPWREPSAWAVGTTCTKEPVERLQEHGGVLLWPRMHRVRRYGALSSRGFTTRLSALRSASEVAGMAENQLICRCPDCGESLSVVKNEDGRVLLLRPSDATDYRLKPGSGKQKQKRLEVIR